ncbi:hypothetical protein CKA32_003898 [Geitlerinema sp. FC II]|nr:hypothetical protein [Geitlerinema sp. CS-897]PPT08890.1 hypothetical protein CKA32_003898 [Geitlerinema sp. FC II]
MEDWTTEFWKAIDRACDEFEAWVDEANQEFEKQVDSWFATSEAISEDLYEAIAQVFPLDDMSREIDRALDDWLRVWFEIDGDFELHWDFDNFDEDSDPFVSVTYFRPTSTFHPACRGCQHYHGQMYGESLLVCGMHPYGWDGETCPDWEGYDTSFPHRAYH